MVRWEAAVCVATGWVARGGTGTNTRDVLAVGLELDVSLRYLFVHESLVIAYIALVSWR